VDIFAACSNSETLVCCYKNVVELNCTYGSEIHQMIQSVLEIADDRDQPVWWVNLLD